MDLFTDTGDYLLLLFFGMVAVAIHAHNLFAQQLPTGHAQSGSRLLSSISVLRLGNRYQFYRGFVIYLFITEVMYLILASSTVILQMSLSAVGRTDLVGAVSSGPALNPLIPFAASTVVIAASQIKPVAEIEQALRRLAHRIAGIPSTVYSVQQALERSLDTAVESAIRDVRMAKGSNQLRRREDLRRQNGELASDSVEASDILWHASRRSEEAYEAVKRIKGLSELEINRFQESFAKVTCLYFWTLGDEGQQVWIGRDTEEIIDLFGSLTPSIEKLAADIKVLQPGKNDSIEGAGGQSLEAQWRTIFRECSRLQNEALTVLALLMINKPEVTLDRYATLKAIRHESLKATPNPLFNAISASTIAGAVVAFTLLSSVLIVKDSAKESLRSNAMNLERMAPAFLDNSRNDQMRQRSLEAIETGLPSWPTALFSEEGLPKSIRDSGDQFVQSWASKVNAVMVFAFWDVLMHLSVFTIAIAVALGVRHGRMIENRWHGAIDSRSRVPPAATYLTLGGYAYLLAFATYLLLNFLRIAAVPALIDGKSMFSPVYLLFFQQQIPRFFLFPLIAFACVWFACAWFDHEQKLRQQTSTTSSNPSKPSL